MRSSKYTFTLSDEELTSDELERRKEQYALATAALARGCDCWAYGYVYNQHSFGCNKRKY